MKKKFLLFLLILLALTGCSKNGEDTSLTGYVPETYKTDMSEYDGVDVGTKVFKGITADELIKMMKNGGSGVILFSSPECRNCQNVIGYIQYAADEVGLDTIYYLNFASDEYPLEETNFTDIVDLFGEVLAENDEGKKSIYTPHLITVKNGKVIEGKLGSDVNENSTPEDIEKMVNEYEDMMKPFVQSTTD